MTQQGEIYGTPHGLLRMIDAQRLLTTQQRVHSMRLLKTQFENDLSAGHDGNDMIDINDGWFTRRPCGDRRWYYLSDANSDLYDTVRESTDEKDLVIKQLLEQLACESRAEHCASPY